MKRTIDEIIACRRPMMADSRPQRGVRAALPRR